MTKSYIRGWEIYFDFDSNNWRYCDNNKPVIDEVRPCKRCGKMPTAEGYDACLGHIDGVMFACCGHGVTEPYIMYETKQEGE